jgi:hypothetical protein
MSRQLVSALLASLLLAACGKSEPGATNTALADAAPGEESAAPGGDAGVDPATAGLNASEPPLPDLGQFKLVSVLMGNGVDDEHVVIHDTRALAAGEPIYASVLSIGAHQGLKLSADWIAPDGKSFAKSEQALVPDSDIATTFKVQHPQSWPPGDYQLRIAINGHTVRTENFAVHQGPASP